MNEKSKKKRDKRVRKKKLLQREVKLRENKERNEIEKLQHLTRQRQTPIVNSVLERNIQVLEKTLDEHEALLKLREENKYKADEMFEKAKVQQAEYAKEFEKVKDELE